MRIQRRMAKRARLSILSVIALISCVTPQRGLPGKVLDEARSIARAPSSFPTADEDYFHDMDGGITPFFVDVDPQDPTQPTWLSFGLCLFKVTGPTVKFGGPMSMNLADAPGFIAQLYEGESTG